jgi:hypothetical protein
MPRDRVEVVDLLSRAADTDSGSTYATAVEWTAVRKPTDIESTAVLTGDANTELVTFCLYQSAQTVNPLRLDRLIDAAGQGYEVQHVQDKHFSVVWDCFGLAMQGLRPGPASALAAVAASATQINLTWVAPTSPPSPLARYELWRSTDGNNFERLADPAAAAVSASATGLTTATIYYFRLRPVAADGQKGDFVTASATTS